MNANVSAKMIERSKLLNQLVLNAETTEEVGKVSQTVLDAEGREVMGIVCQTGFLGRQKQIFAWSEIVSIGRDGILVKVKDMPTENAPELKDSLIGSELWTDPGNRVGKITDYLIELETGKIPFYLFVSSGWQGVRDGVYQLPTTAIYSLGSKRIIAEREAVINAEQYSEGIGQKLDHAAELIKEDYAKTQADWQKVIKGTQTLANQTQKTLDVVGDRVKATVERVQEQLPGRLASETITPLTPSEGEKVEELKTTLDTEELSNTSDRAKTTEN